MAKKSLVDVDKIDIRAVIGRENQASINTNGQASGAWLSLDELLEFRRLMDVVIHTMECEELGREKKR